MDADELERLLKDWSLDKIPRKELRPTFLEEPLADFTRFRLPFYSEPKPVDPRFAQFKEYFIEKTERSKFQPQPYQIYHGTSLEALDRILETQVIRTGMDLARRGELVWGELLHTLGKDYKAAGPKYMHPDAMEAMGITLSESDRRIFGHAFAVFFSPHPMGCTGYAPEDKNQRAILALNKNALDARGYQIVDCKGEGVKIESNIQIDFGFQALLVPDHLVETYQKKMQGNLMASVHPLSDLD
ncbi:MAG: hypothetical protein WCV90_00900 [Candidatus Woesearchaeota archaeon]